MPTSSTTRFDVCVLGAGPAGYAAAMRAHDLGKRVCLIERDRVGGVGIHSGALSSKTMWHLSNDYFNARRTDRGFRADKITLSYASVMDVVREAVAERQGQLVRQLGVLATPSAQGGVVDFRTGAARFVGPHAVEVAARGEGEEPSLVEADFFVIATGSRPRVVPGLPVDGERIVTSDHVESFKDFPESMLVVGAGVVGCEYAAMFGNFGRTELRILDRQPRILPFEDDDVAGLVAANFESIGVTIHHASRLEALRVEGDGVRYEVTGPDGVTTSHVVARALVSVGRVPNTDSLGLEAIGVTLDAAGGVRNAGGQSVVPHIYAAGDTTADVALANVAELEGRHVVEHMFGLEPRPLRYDAQSAIMFLKPEVASVGFNESQAKAAGIPYRYAALSNRLISRNIAMRATSGFLKLLVRNDGSGRLLGLRVVGPMASSTVQGIALLIEMGASLADIDKCVHPHPAITEGVQECARMLLGRSVNKVEVFAPDLLRLGEG